MGETSKWDKHGVEQKVIRLLAGARYIEPDHHLGRPFLTAYQLAILFKEKHPGEFRAIGLEVGGKGSGAANSLSAYLARELSRRIGEGELDRVEGGFLSNEKLKVIAFSDGGDTVTSSLTGTDYDLSMFRLR